MVVGECKNQVNKDEVKCSENVHRMIENTTKAAHNLEMFLIFVKHTLKKTLTSNDAVRFDGFFSSDVCVCQYLSVYYFLF